MPSNKFDRLIYKFPQEESAINRFKELIVSSDSGNEYSIERLIDKINPSSTYYFPSLVSTAVEEGILKKIIRVHSSDGISGIGDYNSIIDLPEEIMDLQHGIKMPITEDNIKIIFTVNK